MERLTKIDGIGANEMIRCFDCGPEKAGTNLENCGYCDHWRKVLDRLAAYEDIGLTPEEITGPFTGETVIKFAASILRTTPERLRELAQAEQEGRMVVLDEPMRPLVWGDNEHNTILCPRCLCDLMGGFQYAPSSEEKMYQCPHCGCPVNATKAEEMVED